MKVKERIWLFLGNKTRIVQTSMTETLSPLDHNCHLRGAHIHGKSQIEILVHMHMDARRWDILH